MTSSESVRVTVLQCRGACRSDGARGGRPQIGAQGEGVPLRACTYGGLTTE